MNQYSPDCFRNVQLGDKIEFSHETRRLEILDTSTINNVSSGDHLFSFNFNLGIVIFI